MHFHCLGTRLSNANGLYSTKKLRANDDGSRSRRDDQTVWPVRRLLEVKQMTPGEI